MPNTDPELIRRLAYSKELYLLAQHFISIGNDIAFAEAIVICDAAVDSLLRTIVQYKGRTIGADEKFPNIISNLKGLLPDNTFNLSPLQRLHDIRNQVQHQYILPADTQARQTINDAVNCADIITDKTLNLRWRDISISELFEDELTRKLYQDAEKAYSDGNKEDAIIYLVATFECARFDEQIRSYGSFITIDKLEAEEVLDLDENNLYFKKILDYIRTIHDEVEILKLRLDYKEYRWFADIAPEIICPTFEKQNWPEEYNKTNSDELNIQIIYKYWKEKLSKDLKRISEAKPDDRYEMELKKNWLPFAFRFVENAIINWQSVKRKGPDILVEEGVKIIRTLIGKYKEYQNNMKQGEKNNIT